jgi:hypothetical protein
MQAWLQVKLPVTIVRGATNVQDPQAFFDDVGVLGDKKTALRR